MQFPMNLIIVYLWDNVVRDWLGHPRHCRRVGRGDCMSESVRLWKLSLATYQCKLQVRSVPFVANTKYVSSTLFCNLVLRYFFTEVRISTEKSSFCKESATSICIHRFQIPENCNHAHFRTTILESGCFQPPCRRQWFICDWIYSLQVYQRQLVSSLLINGSK